MRLIGGIVCLFGLLVAAYGVWAEIVLRQVFHSGLLPAYRALPHPEGLIVRLFNALASPTANPQDVAATIEWILYVVIACGVVQLIGGVAMMVMPSRRDASAS